MQLDTELCGNDHDEECEAATAEERAVWSIVGYNENGSTISNDLRQPTAQISTMTNEG